MKLTIRVLSIWIFIGLFVGTGVFFSGCIQDKASEIPGTTYATQAPASSIAKPPSLSIYATPERPSYLPGEIIEIGITFKNNNKDQVIIDSFPPRITLKNPTSGVVRSYPHGSDTITLESGESTDYILRWNQFDNNGNVIDPGIYFMEISDVSSTEKGKKRLIYSEGADIAQVIIQYPQGAIEKELLVNQSEILNGYIITLKTVTMNFNVSQAYIIIDSCDNSFFEKADQSDKPTPMPTPPLGLDPSGYYRIDDGPEKDFITTGYRIVGDKIVLLWDFEPIPADAKNLHFVITGLGDWEGYCEINVDI